MPMAWARASRPLLWVLCHFLGVMAVMHVDDIVLVDTEEGAGSAAACVRTLAAAFWVFAKGQEEQRSNPRARSFGSYGRLSGHGA